MRQQRVRQEAADVALKAADARYKLALAARLHDRTAQPGGNWITGVLPDPESETLMLRFKQPLEEGEWQLYIDGEPVEIAKTDRNGEYSLTLKINGGKDVLGRDDLIASMVELRDEKDGRLVSSVV